MRRRNKWAAAAGAAALLAGAGGGVAMANGGDGDDAREGKEQSISGTALERASSAALAHTGGGEVTETEVGDEEGYYEVEVTREDGGQVDVHLDSDFNILSTEDDGAGDEEGPNDD